MINKNGHKQGFHVYKLLWFYFFSSHIGAYFLYGCDFLLIKKIGYKEIIHIFAKIILGL